MRKSGSMAKCRAGATIPARLPYRASTCLIAWCLAPKSRPATDSSSQCLRLTDQCLIRSEAFGFAKPWWSFIVDEREARQGGLRAVQCGQEIMRRAQTDPLHDEPPSRSAIGGTSRECSVALSPSAIKWRLLATRHLPQLPVSARPTHDFRAYIVLYRFGTSVAF